MKRIILHWTAGAYSPNATDKRAYHYLIDGDGEVHLGVPVERNRAPLSSGYAAHTLNLNTDSVGVSICCMAGAKESPYDPGDYPMTERQMDALVDLVRELADRYNIPVTRETVLSHAEVQQTLHVTQRGKWDYTRLPFEPQMRGALTIGDHIRARVAGGGHAETERPVPTPAPTTPETPLPPVPDGALARVTASPHLNARRAPSSSSEKLGEYPLGTVLEIVGQNGDGSWCEVVTDYAKERNFTRWVDRRYLELLDGPPVLEPTTPDPRRMVIAHLRQLADDLEKELDKEE